jgi:putative membrane-bound dehydrogenase-like protein
MTKPLVRTALILATSAASLLPALGADGPAPIASTPLLRSGAPAQTLRADLKGAKELHLVVTDGGDGFTADWADWAEPVLIKTDGSRVKLTDLAWKSAKTGFGEVSVGKNAGGKPLRINGEPVSFGIGTHAPSLISFALPEGIAAFESRVGIDNGGSDQGNASSVVFQVYAQTPGPAALASSQKSSNAATKPYGFEEARASLANDMIVAPGLEASLFAAEPQIQNPTNIDIDPRGRVWAVEAVNYRSSFKQWGILREGGDRVVILEDANGDGVAENEKTFWQSPDLKAPLGICVLPQEARADGRTPTHVVVSAAPFVWLVSDLDGDDKADRVEKLFKVTGGWDHDHQVHAFVFGSDGKFYFNFGNEAKDLQTPEGQPITDLAGNKIGTSGKPYRQGLVFRCDLDLANAKASNVETLGWNFRNNYEVCVDSFGTMWQSDNDDDGNKGVRINYVMEFGNYGYTDEITGAGWKVARTNMEEEIPLRHWHLNDPGVVPNLLQTGSGSPTGILINEGALLGPRFANQVIHCDAGPRVVRAYPVTNDGAGYKAEMVNLLESKDSWYRPADVAIAPDGALFVADWYDPGVGGHNMGDHDKGRIRGRIYRVATQGAKASVPRLDLSSAAGCVAALQSPNPATLYVAWQKLHALGAQAENDLVRLAKSENPRFRARALALLARLPGKGVQHLRAGLTDPDADVRIAAIRLCSTLERSGVIDTTPLDEDRALVAQLVRDPNPQVRRQIALSLYRAKEIAPLWAALAQQHDGKDRWYLEALGIGAIGNEDACFDAWLAAVGEKWNTPAGRDIVWRMRSSKNALHLARLLTDAATPPAEAPRYLRAFDFLPASEGKTRALLQLASLGAANRTVAAEALSRLKNTDLNANAEVKNAIFAALERSRGTAQFVDLVRDFSLKDQGPGLLDIATRSPASPEGIEAAKMLLAPEYSAALEREIKGARALQLVEALGNTADQRAVPHLVPVLTDAQRDAGIREQAVKSLAQSRAGVQALLKLARENQFPAQLRLTAAGALATVQMPQFKGDIAQFFPLPSAAGGQALPPVAELARMKGDAARGKAIFAKAEATCIACHRAGTVGVDFGPALSEIGTKLGKEALIEAIIAPNAGVSMGFETTQITMKNGDVALGIIRSETADELILAMPGGIQNRYRKADVSKREKLPYSLMPEGLQAMMSTQDLTDLVEYLFSLKAAQTAK